MRSVGGELLQLTLFHLRTMFRNRVAVAFNLVIPLAFLGIFGSMFAPAAQGNQQIAIGLAGTGGGPMAEAVKEKLAAAGWFAIRTGDEAALREQLDQGDISLLVLLPAAADEGQQQVVLVQDPSANTSQAAAGIAQSVLAELNLDLLDAPPPLTVQVEELPVAAQYNIFDHLMPGQITFMFLGAGIVTVALALAQQRQSGSMRHLFSTPLSIWSWMAGRLVANLILAALQVLVLFAAAMAFFGIHPPVNLAGTVVLLLLSALMTLSIGLAVGTLSKTQETATVVAQVLSIGLAFLGNAMLPLNGAPAFVQLLSRALPTTYMTHSLRLVMMQGKGLGAVLPDMAVLLAVILVCLGVATYQLRRQFLAPA